MTTRIFTRKYIVKKCYLGKEQGYTKKKEGGQITIKSRALRFFVNKKVKIIIYSWKND